MPLLSNEEAEARIKASPADGGGVYFVSGVIMSDWNGPLRWGQWMTPEELTIGGGARAVEDEARRFMWQQQIDGRRGVLFVANVLQVKDGQLVQVDTYATYADDPERPRDQRDLDRPWQPPAGFDGTGDRMPVSIPAGQPQVFH